MHPFHFSKVNIVIYVYYLDSRLFPEKRNGPTDLYERRDPVIQENDLFKKTKIFTFLYYLTEHTSC